MSFYKLSVSKAKTFESCPKKFEFNYILKLKPKDFTFFDFGKLLHKVLEDFHKALIDGSNEPLNALMSRFYKEAKKEFGTKLKKEEIQDCYNIIDSYLEYLSKEENPPKILDVEKAFSHNIKDMVSLVGMIDRSQLDPDGVLHLIDYKTSKSMKYYEDDFFQLKTYAYVVMENDSSIEKVRCSYMFLRHNFQFITKEFTREEVKEIEQQYIDYALNIQEMKEWKANPSFLCNYCGYVDSCSDGKEIVMPKAIKNGETGWK